ncbi:hypothetical protein DB346_19535 [Verrucomicrobia bacterium LW23]|nr:hypothetical protein DB346_19535 [Verrucomicrobia bacterium LW23]
MDYPAVAILPDIGLFDLAAWVHAILSLYIILFATNRSNLWFLLVLTVTTLGLSWVTYDLSTKSKPDFTLLTYYALHTSLGILALWFGLTRPAPDPAAPAPSGHVTSEFEQQQLAKQQAAGENTKFHEETASPELMASMPSARPAPEPEPEPEPVEPAPPPVSAEAQAEERAMAEAEEAATEFDTAHPHPAAADPATFAAPEYAAQPPPPAIPQQQGVPRKAETRQPATGPRRGPLPSGVATADNAISRFAHGPGQETQPAYGESVPRKPGQPGNMPPIPQKAVQPGVPLAGTSTGRLPAGRPPMRTVTNTGIPAGTSTGRLPNQAEIAAMEASGMMSGGQTYRISPTAPQPAQKPAVPTPGYPGGQPQQAYGRPPQQQHPQPAYGAGGAGGASGTEGPRPAPRQQPPPGAAMAGGFPPIAPQQTASAPQASFPNPALKRVDPARGGAAQQPATPIRRGPLPGDEVVTPVAARVTASMPPLTARQHPSPPAAQQLAGAAPAPAYGQPAQPPQRTQPQPPPAAAPRPVEPEPFAIQPMAPRQMARAHNPALNSAAAAFVSALKERIAPFLEENVQPELIAPGREDELRRRVEELVDIKFSQDGVNPGPRLRALLLQDLYRDIPLLNDEAGA